MSLISKMLEADWVKLYYQLPFYPERGGENIKKDIDEVFIKIYRGDAAQVWLILNYYFGKKRLVNMNFMNLMQFFFLLKLNYV